MLLALINLLEGGKNENEMAPACRRGCFGHFCFVDSVSDPLNQGVRAKHWTANPDHQEEQDRHAKGTSIQISRRPREVPDGQLLSC
jgi:hypothetical protein